MNTQGLPQKQQCSTSCTLTFKARCLPALSILNCSDLDSPSFSDSSCLKLTQVVI